MLGEGSVGCSLVFLLVGCLVGLAGAHLLFMPCPQFYLLVQALEGVCLW